MVLIEQGERARHQSGGKRRCGGNGERRRRLPRDLLGARFHLTQACQRALDVLVKLGCLASGRDTRPETLEQRIADLGFQFLDRARYRGLRAPEQTPGGSDASGRHDSGKRFQLTDFHGYTAADRLDR